MNWAKNLVYLTIQVEFLCGYFAKVLDKREEANMFPFLTSPEYFLRIPIFHNVEAAHTILPKHSDFFACRRSTTFISVDLANGPGKILERESANHWIRNLVFLKLSAKMHTLCNADLTTK